MKKEYTKLTRQLFDENMEATSGVEEIIFASLIADTGKKIKILENGLLCTRVDLGTEDSEENYEEVDDPNFVEVIETIVEEVAE